MVRALPTVTIDHLIVRDDDDAVVGDGDVLGVAVRAVDRVLLGELQDLRLNKLSRFFRDPEML